MDKNLTVLYFGFYNPEYSRNHVLIKGLKQNGVEIIECNEQAKSKWRYLKLVWKYLKMRPKYDAMIVGFPGQEAMFLAKFLTRRPIIFDAFTSHYGGYILDRGYYSKRSPQAHYYRFLDKWSCKLADLVLLDTKAHIDFFVREFRLPKEKFKRIFVGANSGIFHPEILEKKDSKFLVHFHGYYSPLQGVKFIIKAAKLLEEKGIFFNLIGQGQTYHADIKLASKLRTSNIDFLEPVQHQKLADYMNLADVCLGIFGNSPKTELVIPNKILEALAMGKPVITANTLAARELLVDGESVLFCRKADPEDLATKTLELKNNIELRNKIAGNGLGLFKSRLTEIIIGAELLEIINKL